MLRNKILYFMILTEVCLLCILYNEYQPVVLLWIAVAMPVVLLVWLFICERFIKITVEEENVVVTRQDFHEAGLVIENKSIFPAGQILIRGNVEGKKFRVQVYLKGKSKVKVLYPVNCEQCGIKKVKLASVVLFDYLRIFKRIKRMNKEINIIVVPKVYDVSRSGTDEGWNFDGESEYYSEDRPGDDPAEIFDIREYEMGDRMSRIHWKLTTKLNKLMVKEYSKPLPDGVVLFLDTKNGGECIDVLFSIGLFMVEEKRKVWINGELVETPETFILEFMKNSEQDNTKILHEEEETFMETGNGRKIVCCLDVIDEERSTQLLKLAGDNRIYLVAEEGGGKDTLEENGVCVCGMNVMDVPAVIERIMNE